MELDLLLQGHDQLREVQGTELDERLALADALVFHDGEALLELRLVDLAGPVQQHAEHRALIDGLDAEAHGTATLPEAEAAQAVLGEDHQHTGDTMQGHLHHGVT